MPISDQEWNEMLSMMMRSGVFVGLAEISRTKNLSDKQAGALRANIFQFFGHRVAEAKREVEKIQAVLHRIEAVCREGMAARSIGPGMIFSPPVDRFHQEVNALDGWVVSLYETDLTILGNINPGTRHQRPQEFGKAMDTLWQKREQTLKVGLKDDKAFSGAWGI